VKWPLLRKRVKLEKSDTKLEVRQAQRELKHVLSRRSEVNGLVNRLEVLNQQNHYSQLINKAMQGGRE
jgi:hypothetical protein